MTTATETWTPARFDARPPYNTLAALTPAITLLTLIGGIVCGHVALSQIRRTGERGAWLAILSLIAAYAVVGFLVLLVVGTLALGVMAATRH